MNIFVGNNAQGKTNILESIIILALTKSHRVGVNPNIIMFNKKKCKIKGVIKRDKIISKLEFSQDDESKQLSLNGTKIRKVSDYISNLNVIVFTPNDLDIIQGSPNIRRNLLNIFTPNDLDIIQGSPNIRRNLLNIELSQISKTYLNTLNQYNKVLKTRNEYLKVLYGNSIGDKKYLDILTDKLIEKAIIIYQLRNDFINKINNEIDKNYRKISNIGNLKIQYLPNIEIDNFSDDEIENKLRKIIIKNYNKELKYGMSLYGPHRDDFSFILDENDLKYFGSQGQQKLAVLSFKLSEISIFKDYTDTYPVLLLDDIFSEFDLNKRKNLLKFINSLDIQSILTTTDLKNINKRYVKDSYIYNVLNGNVERM